MKNFLQLFILFCLTVGGFAAYITPNATCDTTIQTVLTISNVTYTDTVLANVRRVIQPCLNSFYYVNSISVSNYNTTPIRDYIKYLFEKVMLKTLVADYSEIKKLCTVSNYVEYCARATVDKCSNASIKVELKKAVDGDIAFRLSYGTGICKPHSCVVNSLFTTVYEKSDLNTCLGTDGLNEVKNEFNNKINILQNEGYKASIPTTIDTVFTAAPSQRTLYRGGMVHCDLVRSLSEKIGRILKKYFIKTGKQCNVYSKRTLIYLMKTILSPGCIFLGRGPPDVNGARPVKGLVEPSEPVGNDAIDVFTMLQEVGEFYRNASRTTNFFSGLRQLADFDDMVDSEPKFGVCNDVRSDEAYFTMLEVDQLKVETKLTTISGKIYQYYSGVKISILSKTFDVVTTITFENGIDVAAFSNGMTEIKSHCDNRVTLFEKPSAGVYVIKDKCTGLFIICRYKPYTEGGSTMNFYSCVIRGAIDLLGREGHATGDLVTGCFSENDIITGVQRRRKRQTTTSGSTANTMSQFNNYANIKCSPVCGATVTTLNAAVSSDIKDAAAADSYMLKSVASISASQLVVLMGALVALANYHETK